MNVINKKLNLKIIDVISTYYYVCLCTWINCGCQYWTIIMIITYNLDHYIIIIIILSETFYNMNKNCIIYMIYIYEIKLNKFQYNFTNPII